MKRIPIKAAKLIADQYGQDQVIITTWDDKNKQYNVVTYGRTLAACEAAAKGGNFVKRALGFPENLCNSQPARAKRRATG